MNFYQITHEPSDMPPQFRGTMAEAHETAKEIPDYMRASVRIELIDVKTDKVGICNLLNHGGVGFVALRTWRLSPRGGLVDCPNGE